MRELLTVLYLGACVLGFFGTNGQVCNDFDSDVCNRMAQLRPDMCSDSCFSSICTRFCGRCPLKCYKCHEIDHPANCTTLVDCPSQDHYCFTTQTFTDDFEERYNMGCAVKNLCEHNTGKRSDVTVTAGCCSMDNCNNMLPSDMDLLPQRTTVMVQNSTALPITENGCENFDTDICLRLSMADPGFCSNDCIASNICPRMCGKCFQCYECNELDKAGNCTNTRTCTAGHECFMLETLTFDLRPVFRLGCMEETLCQRFGAPIQTGFGRRQTGISLKGGCCKTDLCNDGNMHFQAETTTTTHAPIVQTSHTTVGTNCVNHQFVGGGHRHCPSPYTLANSRSGLCYHYGTHAMTWQESVDYCHGICGRLADFASVSDLEAVFNHINNNDDVWIDAVRDTQGRWVWSNNYAPISSDLSQSLSSSGHLTCAAAPVISLFRNTRLHAHDCTNRLHPLCLMKTI